MLPHVRDHLATCNRIVNFRSIRSVYLTVQLIVALLSANEYRQNTIPVAVIITIKAAASQRVAGAELSGGGQSDSYRPMDVRTST